jgi:voltage-gated potassium channel
VAFICWAASHVAGQRPETGNDRWMSRSQFRTEPLTVSQKINRMLNDNRSQSKRRFDIFISLLVLVSTGILFWGGFTHDEAYNPPYWLKLCDNLILVIFLFEYVARVAYANPDMPKVRKLSRWDIFVYHLKARLKWMITPMAIIDLLAIVPLFALDRAYANFKLFRVIRVLRLMRLYRLAIVYNPLEKLGQAFRRNSLLYFMAFSLVAVTIAMGSLAFYVVEGKTNPNVSSPFDAIWWTIVTLTTVGYGDTVPSSGLGKIVAITLMLSGVILMAVFAGVMSQTMVGYLLDVREERVRMSSTVNHFIICGWNSRGRMVADEISHLVPNEEVIVFADVEEPLNLPDEVTFLRGNPTKESEWTKVRLSVATNVVVLAPPGSDSNAVIADGYTALVVYTIRSFERKLKDTASERSVPLHISAELLDPENYEHITVAGADEVVHTAQVGSNLIAHSSVKPGMGKVVTELISWWGQGIDLEPLPDSLDEGSCFNDVSKELRKSKGYLVVGVVNPDGSIKLNPTDNRAVTSEQKLVVIRDHEDH